MMKKIIKKIAGFLVAGTLSAGVLTGCVSCPTKSVKENIVVLLGNHANAAIFDTSEVEEEIVNACMTYGTVTIIAVDGEPYLVDKFNIPEQKSGLSEEKRHSIAKTQAHQILEAAENAVPKTPELDTLQAVQMAARELHNVDGHKKLIIADSGLSTKGLLQFQSLRLDSDKSEEITKKLNEENAIPDLENISVSWTGIANTTLPQIELYEKNRKILMKTWESILKEGNAKEVNFYTGLSQKPSSQENLPDVTVVEIEEPALLIDTSNIVLSKEPKRVISFDEEIIKFKPGSPELLSSKKQVIKALSSIINDVTINRDSKILLAGTTASAGTREELAALSLHRTETIKKIMIDSGVRPEQIVTAGLGFNELFTKKDTDKHGKFIEDKGKANRKVIVTNIESDTAKSILKNVK